MLAYQGIAARAAVYGGQKRGMMSAMVVEEEEWHGMFPWAVTEGGDMG